VDPLLDGTERIRALRLTLGGGRPVPEPMGGWMLTVLGVCSLLTTAERVTSLSSATLSRGPRRPGNSPRTCATKSAWMAWWSR
jgi:hypothetical protein